MIEISVKLTNDESKFVMNFISHDEDIVLSKDDPKLQGYVKNAIDHFKGNVDDVFVTIKMSW